MSLLIRIHALESVRVGWMHCGECGEVMEQEHHAGCIRVGHMHDGERGEVIEHASGSNHSFGCRNEILYLS